MNKYDQIYVHYDLRSDKCTMFTPRQILTLALNHVKMPYRIQILFRLKILRKYNPSKETVTVMSDTIKVGG